MLWFDLHDILKIDKIIYGIRNLGNSCLVSEEIDLNMLKVLVYHQTIFGVGHPNTYNYEKSLLCTPNIYTSFYGMLIF